MTDRLPAYKRSQLMAKIRGKDTKPEKFVRSLLHGLGYRFRLHRKDLPGTPDIVFSRKRVVIFVHGCFWHGHGCRKGKLPKSRLDYWEPKIQANAIRDKLVHEELNGRGWKVVVVWQCELADKDSLVAKLSAVLDS